MGHADENPAYWDQYSNLQHVQHEVTKNYLEAWFPKLALGINGCPELLYMDTHAGRGKHSGGQHGSPLVAVNALLKHASRDKILANTNVQFFLIERDAENTNALKKEMMTLTLPDKVKVTAETEDCFRVLEEKLDALDAAGQNFVPSFIFVDPYGFTVPGHLLRRLMAFPKVELFINVIWRELDMAISHGRSVVKPEAPIVRGLFDNHEDERSDGNAVEVRRAGDGKSASWSRTLDVIFNGPAWRTIDSPDDDERADQCADLFRKIVNARWGTHLRMLDCGRTRYFLLHLTNNDCGRELMKTVIWKSCPDGGFSASKSNNPRQRLLIERTPNLEPLRRWVIDRLSSRPRKWAELTNGILAELWLEKHLNQVIREMGKDGVITSSNGKFFASNNPELRLVAVPN